MRRTTGIRMIRIRIGRSRRATSCSLWMTGYAQHCAMSYFRENQRRLWVFAVALGAVFSVLSLIWIGVTYMQYSASGVELSRARALLMRVIIGLVIMACALLIWEGLNEYLFSGVESWTQNRGVFYDLK